MEKVRKRLAAIDGVELRTAMLFLWVSSFCFFGFVISLSFPGLAFADVACFLFFLMTLVEGLLWLRRAVLSHSENSEMGFRKVESRVEAGEEEAEEEAGEGIPSEARREREMFYGFIYGICVRNLLSENQWAALERGDALAYINRTRYRAYMPHLQRAGVVTPVDKGGKRKVLLGFSDALTAVELYTGERGYWDKAGCGYHTRINPGRNPSPS
ncbi:MAG TPA: hypothetical protein VH186_32265 [Chloroflexia bacterium]|nr:hypothetical protein [Chloroflexia bacterium]